MFGLMATDDHIWRVPPANLLLGSDDDVHVWRACLDVKEPRLRSLSHIISKDELRKARRFHFKRDRERFIVRRGLLRTILGRYLDVEPNRLHFCYNPYGKPTLDTSGKEKISFNLSHSHGLALFAIARVGEIGVDLERIRPGLSDDNIAERFFSHPEIALLKTLSGNIRRQKFFSYWSRKEAYIKARGKGLAIPLACFDVSMAPGNPVVLLNPEGVPESSRQWFLRDLIVGSNYAAAIAAEGNGWRLSCWQWPEHQSESCA